jgi:tRNA pseudouridine55 synthase
VTELPGDFVLPVDKPEGPTSHDVVGAARRALGVKRVGHTGTLDPFASGLLLLCVGKATRLAEYFSGLDKTYEATARLGIVTDTLDPDGSVVAESAGWRGLSAESIESAMDGFRGEITQVPPQYSAKKVDGERAYRRARSGETVELAACAVNVLALEVTSVDLPAIGFRVRCSSGTYVRALARDIGEALGVGAHLTHLRRTAVGAWQVEGAVALDELADRSRVAGAAVAPLAALTHLPTVELSGDAAARMALGQSVPVTTGAVMAGPVAVAHEGALLAIGETEDGLLKPRKVFTA